MNTKLLSTKTKSDRIPSNLFGLCFKSGNWDQVAFEIYQDIIQITIPKQAGQDTYPFIVDENGRLQTISDNSAEAVRDGRIVKALEAFYEVITNPYHAVLRFHTADRKEMVQSLISFFKNSRKNYLPEEV